VVGFDHFKETGFKKRQLSDSVRRHILPYVEALAMLPITGDD
jgi:hypothetical protein